MWKSDHAIDGMEFDGGLGHPVNDAAILVFGYGSGPNLMEGKHSPSSINAHSRE
jgi:hypothetical protein